MAKTPIKAESPAAEEDAAAIEPRAEEAPREKLKVKGAFLSLIQGEKISADGGATWIQLSGEDIVDQDGKPAEFNAKLEYEVFQPTEPEIVTVVGFLNCTKEHEGDMWPTAERAVQAVGPRTRDYLAIAVPINLDVRVDPQTKLVIDEF